MPPSFGGSSSRDQDPEPAALEKRRAALEQQPVLEHPAREHDQVETGACGQPGAGRRGRRRQRVVEAGRNECRRRARLEVGGQLAHRDPGVEHDRLAFPVGGDAERQLVGARARPGSAIASSSTAAWPS